MPGVGGRRRPGQSAARQQGGAPDHPDDASAARLAAIPWLARRDFSSPELRERLLRAGYASAAVEGALEHLRAERAVDDARYAERYVAYQAGRGLGPVRIRRALLALGLAAELVESALAAAVDWPARARELRIRRFGVQIPESWSDKARQARFLQYRGFSSDHIRFALGSDFDPDDSAD
jgi:regulatory protein